MNDVHFYSVDHLADVLRQAIENETKLLHEITLPGTKFLIVEVRQDMFTLVLLACIRRVAWAHWDM